MVLGQCRRYFRDMGESVRGFERRENPFELRHQLEGGQRFLVGDADITDALSIVQP